MASLLLTAALVPNLPMSASNFDQATAQKKPISKVDSQQIQELLFAAHENNFQSLKKYLYSNFEAAVLPLFFIQFKELVRKNDATKQPWKTLHNVVDRWAQLETIPEGKFEKQQAKPLDLLKVALFIETEMLQSNEQFFNCKATGLGWNLQRDANNVYLFAVYSRSTFKSYGGFKKVAGAVQLSLKNTALPPSISVYARMTNEEAKTLLNLQGAGVVECVSDVSLAGKRSVILKKYDGDARMFSSVKKIRSLSQRILFARLALFALDCVHKKGYVHADVKLENILLRLKKDGTIEDVRLCDFGLTTTAVNQARALNGSPESTTPEMAGLVQFSGDERQSDVWALGCALLKFEFLEKIPWSRELTSLAQKTPDHHLAKQLFKKHFSEVKTKLQCADSAGELAYRQIISQLLTLDPAKRITAAQAEERLAKIPSNPSLFFKTKVYGISLWNRGLNCCC